MLVRECQCEVEKLKAERQKLLERIQVIDQDVQTVSTAFPSLVCQRAFSLIVEPIYTSLGYLHYTSARWFET